MHLFVCWRCLCLQPVSAAYMCLWKIHTADLMWQACINISHWSLKMHFIWFSSEYREFLVGRQWPVLLISLSKHTFNYKIHKACSTGFSIALARACVCVRMCMYTCVHLRVFVSGLSLLLHTCFRPGCRITADDNGASHVISLSGLLLFGCVCTSASSCLFWSHAWKRWFVRKCMFRDTLLCVCAIHVFGKCINRACCQRCTAAEVALAVVASLSSFSVTGN